MHTIRSVGGTSESSVERIVVFPDPVAPETARLARAAISARSTGANAGAMVPHVTSSSRVNARGLGTRKEISAHSPESGGRTACSRVPVSYTHLRAHETRHDLVCRLLLEKKKQT